MSMIHNNVSDWSIMAWNQRQKAEQKRKAIFDRYNKPAVPVQKEKKPAKPKEDEEAALKSILSKHNSKKMIKKTE